jgi:hypothetical protein
MFQLNTIVFSWPMRFMPAEETHFSISRAALVISDVEPLHA